MREMPSTAKADGILGGRDVRRIVHVQHVLPYDIVVEADSKALRLEKRRGHSALQAAVRSLAETNDSLLIGQLTNIPSSLLIRPQDGENLSKLCMEAKKVLLGSPEHCKALILRDTVAHGHYEDFCKHVLWPLFHYVVWQPATNGRSETSGWTDYLEANQRYADAVISEHKPGDLIWIHDYHLLLVPRLIRQQIPGAQICLFLHSSFPSSEIFRCLPQRKEVLEGMLGADYIGFQTHAYSRHFMSCSVRCAGKESVAVGVYNDDGRMTRVGVHPTGVDVNRISQEISSPSVQAKIDALREIYHGKFIIAGRDKLDVVKGVTQKLLGFERFLKDHPEMRKKVVMIEVTSPSIVVSHQLERKVSEIVDHINGHYGSLEQTLVHHYHQILDRDDYYALLSVADCALVTSLRDGASTTSLEYIICQQNHYSPLILSEFTGTAGSAVDALLVNPWDTKNISDAIDKAIHMPSEEKRLRHQSLMMHIRKHTAQSWANAIMDSFTSHLRSGEGGNRTPFLEDRTLLNVFKAAEHRLILLDYDGTLTPIVTNPDMALPSKQLMDALLGLSTDPRNKIFIISGRDAVFLDRHLGRLKALGFSAEHGCFMRAPEGDWLNLTQEMDMSWMDDVAEIFQYYTERTAGSNIERKRASITWHYRQSDPDFGTFQAKECQNHLENAILSKRPIEVLVGKKNLEVRPSAMNKGEIVQRLLLDHPSTSFVMCCGDDRTDEDMFRALLTRPHSRLSPDSVFAITVGPADKQTLAKWHVQEPQQIVELLDKMAKKS